MRTPVLHSRDHISVHHALQKIQPMSICWFSCVPNWLVKGSSGVLFGSCTILYNYIVVSQNIYSIQLCNWVPPNLRNHELVVAGWLVTVAPAEWLTHALLDGCHAAPGCGRGVRWCCDQRQQMPEGGNPGTTLGPTIFNHKFSHIFSHYQP